MIERFSVRKEVLVHCWLYVILNWSTADLALGNTAVRQHCCYFGLLLMQFDARPFVVRHIMRLAELSSAYL